MKILSCFAQQNAWDACLDGKSAIEEPARLLCRKPRSFADSVVGGAVAASSSLEAAVGPLPAGSARRARAVASFLFEPEPVAVDALPPLRRTRPGAVLSTPYEFATATPWYQGDRAVSSRPPSALSAGRGHHSSFQMQPGGDAMQGSPDQAGGNLENEEQDANNKLQEMAGKENPCPEGKKECIEDCHRDDNNFKKQSACQKRCTDSCQDESDISACPEGKPACQRRCDDVASGDEMKLAGCKARCVTACCPEGRDECLATCQEKPEALISSCETTCRSNCEAPPPDVGA
eukprot:TRINITY_DN32122_c0_g1_i1.p1 TRINITY_DN32122_c0_g1~~TRINITY_DN32122_c0_g1_i1.p1  ORF type:complete len:290 (+),score=54.66 TRINITY_DN32122_c0_g1_i1:84-953(+)